MDTRVSKSVELYQEWVSENGLSAAGQRFNAIEELTGPTLSLEGIFRVCDFLALAEAMEQGLDEAETWVGSWQPEMLTVLWDKRRAIWQGPRQETGKSYTASRFAAALIACGLRTIIAMPTITQGSRILFRGISRNLRRLERVSPLYREKDRQDELLFTNGGQLLTLSSDEGAEKEGYTCDFLLVDEGHKTNRRTFGIFEPFLSKAKQRGTAFSLIIGIGGNRQSLIEEQKQYGYTALRITPSRMEQENPKLKPIFDEYRESLTAHDWRIMYECLPELAGTHLCFPVIYPACRAGSLFGASRRYQGIDVGRLSDRTVLTSLLRQGLGRTLDFVRVLDPIDFGQQAKQIADFCRGLEGVQFGTHGIMDTCLEVNGLGRGLYDILEYGVPPQLPPVLPGVQAIPLTYDLKQFLYDEVSRQMRRGELAVPDDAQRVELNSIGFEVRWSEREGSHMVYDHSDLASSLLMACAGAGGIGGSF